MKEGRSSSWNSHKLVRNILLLVILGLLLLLGFLNKKFVHEIKNIKGLRKLDEGILYFGKPSCPNCEMFKPILNEMADEERVKVYYFNTDYFRENELLDSDEMAEVLKEFNVERVPSLKALAEGKILEEFDFTKDEGETTENKMAELSDFLNKYGK